MKPAYFFIFLLISQNLFAQGNESEAYHEARMKLTIPSYGLAKVKTLISKINGGEDDESGALDSKVYTGLSLREKFTYHMIHAESYSQICDAEPPIQEEHKKIFANLPDAFGEQNWSARQKDFFLEHKDSVIEIMKESIARTNKVGLNFKLAIIEMNGVSIIPTLLETYKKNTTTKDLDILTTFMLLMIENKYEPFLKSASFTRLYSDDADYMAYLNYNKANEDLIIQRVTAFYNAQRK